MICGLNNRFRRGHSNPQQLPGMFMWLRADYGITLNYRTLSGTVAVTNGSTTVTGTGTNFQDTHVGARIKLDASGVIRTVVSRASATSLEVDLPYDSTGSGLAFSMGFVSNWADMLGLGYSASQGTATNQGLWRDNTVNGRPAIYFAGGTQQLETNFLDDHTRLTIYAVVKDDSIDAPATHRYVIKQNGSTENHAIHYALGSTFSKTDGGTIAVTTFNSAGQNLCITGFSSGYKKHTGFFNRQFQEAIYSGTGVNNTPATLIIGGGETTKHFNGRVFELMFYKEAHSVPMMLDNIHTLAEYYKIQI